MKAMLYEPQEGKYDLPIFDHDNAVSAFDWRYLIDTYIANYGHKANPQMFKKHIREFLDMISEDVMETYELCEERIIEEVKDG